MMWLYARHYCTMICIGARGIRLPCGTSSSHGVSWRNARDACDAFCCAQTTLWSSFITRETCVFVSGE